MFVDAKLYFVIIFVEYPACKHNLIISFANILLVIFIFILSKNIILITSRHKSDDKYHVQSGKLVLSFILLQNLYINHGLIS